MKKMARQQYESYPVHWEYVEDAAEFRSSLIDSLVSDLIKPGLWGGVGTEG